MGGGDHLPSDHPPAHSFWLLKEIERAFFSFYELDQYLSNFNFSPISTNYITLYQRVMLVPKRAD